MSSLHQIIYIMLVACLLPYAFTMIAKMTAGFSFKTDNQSPRDFLAKATGVAARANAVQQNSFESLPFFLASMLMAEYLVLPEGVIIKLGITYLVLRVLYGLAYLANWGSLRTILWTLSMVCPALLLILTARI